MPAAPRTVAAALALISALLLLLAEPALADDGAAATATSTTAAGPDQDADVGGAGPGPTKFLYFAYGSNLLARRIQLMNPTARRFGIGLLKVGLGQQRPGLPLRIAPFRLYSARRTTGSTSAHRRLSAGAALPPRWCRTRARACGALSGRLTWPSATTLTSESLMSSCRMPASHHQ